MTACRGSTWRHRDGLKRYRFKRAPRGKCLVGRGARSSRHPNPDDQAGAGSSRPGGAAASRPNHRGRTRAVVPARRPRAGQPISAGGFRVTALSPRRAPVGSTPTCSLGCGIRSCGRPLPRSRVTGPGSRRSRRLWTMMPTTRSRRSSSEAARRWAGTPTARVPAGAVGDPVHGLGRPAALYPVEAAVPVDWGASRTARMLWRRSLAARSGGEPDLGPAYQAGLNRSRQRYSG